MGNVTINSVTHGGFGVVDSIDYNGCHDLILSMTQPSDGDSFRFSIEGVMVVMTVGALPITINEFGVCVERQHVAPVGGRGSSKTPRMTIQPRQAGKMTRVLSIANRERDTLRQQLADVSRERDAIHDALRRVCDATGVVSSDNMVTGTCAIVGADLAIEWIESAKRIL